VIVGLPGTGIGGLFYLLSALALPLREASRRVRDRTQSIAWRVVAGQTAIAGGILAGIWVTGLLLGAVLGAVRSPMTPGVGSHSGSVLRTATFLLSFGTLAAVLLLVELLRLCLHRRTRLVTPIERGSGAETQWPTERKVAVAGGGRGQGRGLMLLVLLEIGTAAHPRTAVSQHGNVAAAGLARADSVFAAGDAMAAALAYAAVLAADSQNSRATYRLADLRRRNPKEALRLFQRYVSLEPSDPWGYLAVADMLARLGRYHEAVQESDSAVRLAPNERDAVIGRARVLARAGRTDAAVVAYHQWLATHDRDPEAWRELARELARAGRPGDAAHALARAQSQAFDPGVARRLATLRAAAAPAFTPIVSGSRDSDRNTTLRLGGAAELAATGGGAVRLGMSGSREQVGDGFTTIGLDAVAVNATWRPRATVKVEAAAGAARFDGSGGSSATMVSTGQLRARWRAPGRGPAFDLRAERSVIDASPLLVANRVVRSDLRGIVELPVAGGLKLRALGRAAALSDSAELNHRTSVAGVVAFAATPSIEVSGQVHQLRYAHSSSAGYFAPRLAQIVEAGTYVEFETGSVLCALDAGAGVQRVAAHGAHVGPWRRALRLYALIALPLSPGHDLRLELDGEDSQIANETVTSGQWRYGSAMLSLRWALP
jgi:Flp pilus assembly protein TadD